MPYDLHIVRTQDFLRCTGEGMIDLETSKKGLAALAKACMAKGVRCVLLDVRDAQASLRLADMYELAKTFHETGFQQEDRLAILHRYRGGERAEFFALCANERGWNVRAFESYEDAMAWFSPNIEELK